MAQGGSSVGVNQEVKGGNLIPSETAAFIEKGFVLTDIDLPFGRVLWLSFQFFVAGLILAIPIWLIIFLIVS